jgi:hypothetical protein
VTYNILEDSHPLLKEIETHHLQAAEPGQPSYHAGGVGTVEPGGQIRARVITHTPLQGE